MQILKNRPLAVLCLALAITAVLSVNSDTHRKGRALVLAFVLTLLFLTLRRTLPRWKKMLSYLFFATLGISVALLSSYLYFDVSFGGAQRSVGEKTYLEGVVLERSHATAFSSTLCVDVERINGETNGERVILQCAYPSALQVGERFCATVYQRAFDEADGYAKTGSYLSDGYTRLFESADESDVTVLGQVEGHVGVRLRQWNRALSVRLYDAIERDAGAIHVALLLGNREFIDTQTTMEFQRAGISHMLALSGMHVAVLIGFFELLGRLLRLSRLTRAMGIPPVLIAYLLLTGCSPSTVRAVLMMCVLYIGFLVRANYDAFVSLCLVLALYLTVTPYAVLDLSLWMSFLAAAGIIVFLPAVRTVSLQIRLCKKPLLRVLRRPLASAVECISIGFFANAGLLLLSAWMYGTVSLVGIPATILLSTPMSLLLILSIPTLLFPRVKLFSAICGVLSRLLERAAHAFSEIEEVLLSMESPVEEIFLLLFTLLLIVFAIVKCKHAVCLLVVVVSMTCFLAASYLSVVTAPVMRVENAAAAGNCTLLMEGKQVDVWEGMEGTTAEVNDLVAALLDCGYTEIDEWNVSVYNNKRVYVIELISDRVRVRSVCLPMPRSEAETAIAKRIEETCARRSITVHYGGD